MAIVEHSIFLGKDSGLTIYVRPENSAGLLKSGEEGELGWAEKVVLVATRSYKSSYAGNGNYRFTEANRETGISQSEWDEAKESLIKKGMLNKSCLFVEQCH